MLNDDTICVLTVPAEFLKAGPVKGVLLGVSVVTWTKTSVTGWRYTLQLLI